MRRFARFLIVLALVAAFAGLSEIDTLAHAGGKGGPSIQKTPDGCCTIPVCHSYDVWAWWPPWDLHHYYACFHGYLAGPLG